VSWPLAGLTRPWRALWRPRGFLPLASFTLAIGLAAFTSAFAMAESLLRAPPFPHHARIVLYGEQDRDPGSRAASPMFYDAIGLPQGAISRGAAQVPESVNLRSGNREKLASAQRVDAGFLPTLGVTSVFPEDPSIPFDQGVVLSHAFWHDWMGADANVVGRRIDVNGTPMIVRGVLPANYRWLADIDLLMPLPATGASGDSAANLVAIARLGPGVSGDTVARRMQATLAAHHLPLHPGCGCVSTYGTTPLDVMLTSRARPVVLLYFGCSLLVLAVAGVNLSNLMLTRALQRTQETCLTIAFGGLGWRPRIPLIMDVVAISIGSLTFGLPLAHVLVVAVRPLVPTSWLLSALPVDLDWRACVAAVLASVTVCALSAMLGSVHVDSDRLLRMQFSRDGTSPAGLAQRARRLLLLVQMAVATLLLVLGVSAVGQMWRMMGVSLGFQPASASFVEVSPDAVQFPQLGDVRHAADVIRSAAMKRPGVVAAGLSTWLPVGSGYFMPFRLPNGTSTYVEYGLVSPGAMESMGVSLIAGRSIGAGDLATTPAVAVVNQAYLDRIDSRGIGGWVLPASRHGANRPMRIVGVVADTRPAGAEQATPPAVFLPLPQVDPEVYGFIRRFVRTFVVIRGPGQTVADAQALQRLIQHAVPGLAAGTRQTFRQLASEATAQARRNAVLAAVYAGMALSLACIGLYAIQSLEATSAHRDIALRDALGATPMDLLGHLVSRGVSMAMPGVALGLVAAVIVERTPVHPALETGAIDVGVIAAVALLMIVAALVAVALPSLRAAGVRPASILRNEPAILPRWPRHHESIPR